MTAAVIIAVIVLTLGSLIGFVSWGVTIAILAAFGTGFVYGGGSYSIGGK